MSNNTPEIAEVRTLSDDELGHVSGAALQILGGVALGIATNALYDWLKAPGKASLSFSVT